LGAVFGAFGWLRRIRMGSMISDFGWFSFRFERFFPHFIRFFLNRKLNEIKKASVLTDYEGTAKRKGKYHYLFEVDLFLKTEGR